jgi:uncharacterized protein with PQ loop repeat
MSVSWEQLVPLIIGYVGSTLLALSMMAQIRAYYFSKDVTTLSYGFIFFQFVVNIMYLIYNISVMALPVLVGNALMIFFLLIMLGQKYYYTHAYRSSEQNDIEMGNLDPSSTVFDS